MRTIVFLFFSLFSMIPFAFCENHGVIRMPSPKDPFADMLPESKYKMNAYKIIQKRYEGGLNLSNTHTTFYDYSKDGLTVFSHNGNNKPITTYTYYPDGKLRSITNHLFGDNRTSTYTYTEDGRFLSNNYQFGKTQCFYTNTGVDSLVSWLYSDRYEEFIKYEKYIVSYNSKGYKIENFRYNFEKESYTKGEEILYEFDKNDRLLKTTKQESNGKKSTNEYFYSKNQIEIYSNNNKVKYIYDEKNDLIENTYYDRDRNGNWYIYFTDIYSYTYEESTATENIIPTNTNHIYTSSGKIIVTNTKHGERINVYDISGRLRYTTISKSDKEEINLPTNQIYIVQVGDKRSKLKL